MRLTPADNSRQMTVFDTALTLKTIKDGNDLRLDLPAGIKLARPVFSSDGRWISFARFLEDGVELWIVETATGKARALTPTRLNMVLSGIA